MPSSPTQGLPDYVRALLGKRAYPHAVQTIELIQTHASYVFLVDDQVYKLKKPVDLGFLDFTTIEKRRAACQAEVRLNRRGCPGNVYIGVEPLIRREGSYYVGGQGEPVDYLVHMKRLPRERMLDVLLERSAVDFDMIRRLAVRLAELHRNAQRDEAISSAGGFAQHVRNWHENLRQVEAFTGRTLSSTRLTRLQRFMQRMTQREAELLERRERDGRVRDCHGDLRSDAVCFDPSVPGGICLYDCIEFNDSFRYSDTGLDAAFLAMDLDYRGHADLSDLFIGIYVQALGDTELPLLLNFFKCYRAVVRGKVESLLLDDGAVGKRQKAAARRRAKAYFALAEHYSRPSRPPALVLVTGPSGTGKSVLAGALASRLGAVLLATDLIRLELYEKRRRGAPIDTGLYSQKARDRVYIAMESRAAQQLEAGRSLVLDGTYIERRLRLPIESLAQAHGRRLLVLECFAPDEAVEQRQRRRAADPSAASEGRWEVYLAQKARLEPATEVAAQDRLRIDTTEPIDRQLEAVEARLYGELPSK